MFMETVYLKSKTIICIMCNIKYDHLCYQTLYSYIIYWEKFTALKPLHIAAINCANKRYALLIYNGYAAINNIKVFINKLQSKFPETRKCTI